MYNSINPINITYRNPRQAYGSQNFGAQEQQTPINGDEQNKKNNQQFPNGAKVAIDYTKNTINISQIVTDFKSTILAINAPDDISEEVYSYLSLVEKESKKSNPSRDIIVSNLKNASKVSDSYIAKSLNKPSKVVEGWIDALFMQNIELKSDPTHINPDFQLEIPERKQKTADTSAAADNQNLVQAQITDEFVPAKAQQTPEITVEPVQIESQQEEEIKAIPFFEDAKSTIPALKDNQNMQLAATAVPLLESTPKEEAKQTQKPKPAYISSEHDRVLSKSLKEAKQLLYKEDDPASALETLNDALGEANADTNSNLRAALHFERGKIFDEYDYVNYALRDYYEATKCEDDNLKSKAHLNMARIYDDYVEFEPALEHYQDAVGYSAEADNLHSQSKILSEMASMYADRFDLDSVQMLSELALESANNSGDSKLVAYAYSSAGKNYEYMGEDFQALESYKNAVKAVASSPEDADLFEMRAQNYEDAARIMEKLGNQAKAENLLSKARLYRQRARLEQISEAA